MAFAIRLFSASLIALVCVAIATPADEPTKKTEPAKKVEPTKLVLPSLLDRILPGGKTPAQKEAEAKGTHTATTPIKVIGTDGKTRLQTISIDGEGRVLALVAPPRGYGAAVKNAFSEVHVFSPEGKAIKSWKVSFHAQAINPGPDGSVYVAGDGKVAKFDKVGKLISENTLPHLEKLLTNKDAMKKEAEEEAKRMTETRKRSLENMKKLKENLEKVAEEKRTAAQKRMIQQYDSIIKNYEKNEKTLGTTNIDSIIATKMGRLRVINSVAVSEKDIFIATGETKGYGYAVWRMDHDYKNAKQVMTGLSGCCGQMDVQCCGGDLLVAQNTLHRFARFDREGKAKGAWGKRGTGTEADCFGGCCNPMNLRSCKGDIYTAESEGLIKRFSEKGEFVSVVGYAPLTGGCKNVAVAVSPDGSKVYFADQPGSQIIVLTKKTKEK